MLFEALCLLIVARLGLTFSSMQKVQSLLLRPTSRTDKSVTANVGRMASIITVVARLVPGASCLTQGLAYQALLQRRGIASDLKIGVRRVGQAGLAAHAWVLIGGKVALGGSMHDLAGFSPIAEFGSGPS